jgi:hypothetical protein
VVVCVFVPNDCVCVCVFVCAPSCVCMCVCLLQDSSGSTMVFTRAALAGSDTERDISAVAGESTILVWAYGSGSSLSYHSSRGSVTVDLMGEAEPLDGGTPTFFLFERILCLCLCLCVCVCVCFVSLFVKVHIGLRSSTRQLH